LTNKERDEEDEEEWLGVGDRELHG